MCQSNLTEHLWSSLLIVLLLNIKFIVTPYQSVRWLVYSNIMDFFVVVVKLNVFLVVLGKLMFDSKLSACLKRSLPVECIHPYSGLCNSLASYYL